MSTESNPYSQPVAEEPASQTEQTVDNTVVNFVPIMRRWERLRWIYNGALIVFSISLTLIAFPRRLVDIDFCFMLCAGGLFSNLCFLLGPAIEAYGTRFRIWPRAMTSWLFVAGLILTALLAAAAILTYPNFNI